MKPTFRKRFFAWTLRKGDPFNHALYGEHKRNLFQNVSGQVVEIGPGTGVNFKYLPEGINWVGIEPNEAFHSVLKQKAEEKNIQARLLKGDASHIPLPDNDVDVVICTLVLCSVVDPAAAIAEMKRILKPGGKLIFIEHVAAREKTFLRTFQNTFNPVNQLMADGCNCNRETWTYIEQARFKQVELSHRKLKGALKIHSPHIMGFAIK